jgi:uncharacterized repeat protein (TIGR03803 family)
MSWLRSLRFAGLGFALTMLISIAAAQAKLEVLYNFGAQSNDGSPGGVLLLDKSGNLYGTTMNGGANDWGSVFEISRSGSSWTKTTLYSFVGGVDDKQGPSAGVVSDNLGNLYGTTYWGGANNAGTIFELSPPWSKGGSWAESVLYTFSAYLGSGPGGLLRDNDGALYGATLWGDSVFKLSPPLVAGDGWSADNLFTFDGADGLNPFYEGGPLIADKHGNLYGTTDDGGTYGGGVAFELSPPASEGDTWTETVLYNFGASLTDSDSPMGSVAIDDAGNLYGTATAGGRNGLGTVFKLSPPAAEDQSWREQILHSFSGPDGANPWAGPIIDRKGNLYGVTTDGGELSWCCGVLFELSPGADGTWTETVLHTFSAAGYPGSPSGGLIMDARGDLYGSSGGGTYGEGMVFKVRP